MGKLTPQQKRFCNEYVKDLNATKAALRANYSKNNARQQGSKLLTKTDIRNEVSKIMKARGKRVQRSQDDILTDIISCKNISIESNNMHATARFLELEGKHQAMFTEKRELSNPDGTLRPIVTVNIPSNGRK